jgi:hypothetical protein
MFLVELHVYVLGKLCFVGGMGMVECCVGQVGGGRRVCEGKWILKSNISPENK